MKPKFLIFAVLLGALPVATAAADPYDGYKQRMEKRDKGHERGEYKYEERRGRHGEYKYEEKGPGYKIERKRDRNGEYSYEYKGNRPPPWAPAHGWRRKHARGDYRPRDGAYQDTTYLPPFDIGAGRCNREVLGAVLGGATGAVVGSQIGKGTGRLVATAAGTVVGFLLGGNIGRSMDEVDQNCVGQALEHARDTQPVVWQKDDGPRYEVKPTATYRDREDRYCREYQTTVIIGGRTQRASGTACRQPDGSWQRVN